MSSDSDSGRVVLVDMDGVLADFDHAVLERLAPEIARVPRTNFYIARDYPAHMDDVKAIYSHPESSLSCLRWRVPSRGGKG